MTEVEFHTGVTDPLDFACRLLRKAYRQGVQVLVTAPADVLGALDRMLWTFDERDFIPHVRVPGAAVAAAAMTPIWLATGDVSLDGAPTVRVNIGADAPAAPQALQRLIEIVGAEPDEAARGRERWRAYKAAGLEITHHPAGARE